MSMWQQWEGRVINGGFRYGSILVARNRVPYTLQKSMGREQRLSSYDPIQRARRPEHHGGSQPASCPILTFSKSSIRAAGMLRMGRRCVSQLWSTLTRI